MICLHYKDERELAQALHSIASRCQSLGARLLFLGSEAAWEEALKAIRNLDPSALQGLTFRPLTSPKHEPGGDHWNATIEVIRSALLEASVVSGPMVAWVDSPLPLNGTPLRTAMRDYRRSLDMTPGSSTVICAYRLADIPEVARASLLETFDTVINAKMLLPRCPSWLINRANVRNNEDLTPALCIPAPTVETDLQLTTFVQAEKLAALGQLAAGVAHELGNPLTIISSSLQYLHKRLTAANDPAGDFTTTALANVERMHGLLRSMLNFAAVKKPRFELSDLKEVISDVLRFTSTECVRRGITVEVAFDPALPRVWVEPPGVKQIVLNLVKNGLDAMVEGGNTLQVRTRMAKDEQTTVVEIDNNGPSVPTDILPHLFRPFHTTKDEGTGLGLYLSRQIAKEHGGDLEAENLPKGGVRFTLTLPVDRRKGGENGSHPDRRRRA
ncbi:MAG TPA: ATP-binding protein [Myxococcota bacterium]|nr:ATP-binding protein [Myxococcota bacterium]